MGDKNLAEYGINEVCYNDDHSKIQEVHALEITKKDDGKKYTGNKHTFSKESIILKIESNDKVTTLIKNNDKWDMGSEVKVYTVDKEKFIKTESNSKKADNLGELPEYDKQ